MSHYPLFKKPELSLTCLSPSSTYGFVFGHSPWLGAIVWVLFPLMFWFLDILFPAALPANLAPQGTTKNIELVGWIF